MLTESEKLLKNMVQEFVRSEIAPHSESWRANKGYPKEVFAQLGELGLMGLQIPESYGGTAVNDLSYVLAIEEIAYGDCALSTAFSVHNSLAPKPIIDFGSEALKQKYLPKMATGEALGCFCLTEPEAGSNAAAIALKATRSGDNFHLKGTKQFITSGKNADLGIVFARTGDDEKKGLSAFVIDMDLVDVIRLEDKMGQEASDCAQLGFDCTVAAENMLGTEGMGYKIALSGLECGRLGIAAQSLGVAKRAFHLAVDYAKSRQSFGKPLTGHQAIEFMLADMATEIAASEALLYTAAKKREAGVSTLKDAAMAKLKASEVALMVTDKAIQIHGGYGYLKDYAVEGLYRDARVTTLYEGTSEIQRLIIGRAVSQ